MFAAAGPHVSIVAEEVFTIFGVPVTNSMILGSIGYVLLVVGFIAIAKAVARGSKNRIVLGVQWVFELLVKMTEDVVGNKKVARSIAPLAITIFFAVMLSNWIGVLPGVGSIMTGDVPLFRGLAADLNFTFALAAITMVTVQLYAIKQFGVFGNVGRYLINPIKNPVGAFEGILELVGEFSRFVALSMRLFGNVFGGEVLLTVIAFLGGWFAFLPLPIFMGFELFIGALQAFVFYMLTIIFVSLAISHHGESSHTEHDAQASPAPAK